MHGIEQIKAICTIPVPMVAGTESNEAIAHRLELTRVALGFPSQNAFAAALRIEPGKWNNYTRARHRIAHEIVLEICRRWGLTTDWIYRGITTGLHPDLANALERAADALRQAEERPRPGRPRKNAL